MIEDHIEDITTNRLPRIARATGHTIEEVKDALEAIRPLDPVPGREYGESPAETIHHPSRGGKQLGIRAGPVSLNMPFTFTQEP